MEPGVFLSETTILIAAIVAVLIAAAVVFIMLWQHKKLKRSLPERGMKQPSEDSPKPRAYVRPEPVPEPARRCANCGHPAEDGDIFCLKCGNKL